MKMTTEEARNLGIKAIENCSNTEPDAAFQIIADAIFYACQDEAAALDEERWKARLEEAKWWFAQIDDIGNLCEKSDDCQFCKRINTLQTPEGKEGQ